MDALERKLRQEIKEWKKNKTMEHLEKKQSCLDEIGAVRKQLEGRYDRLAK